MTGRPRHPGDASGNPSWQARPPARVSVTPSAPVTPQQNPPFEHPSYQHVWPPHYTAMGWRAPQPPPPNRRRGWMVVFALALLGLVGLVPLAASHQEPASTATRAPAGQGGAVAGGQGGVDPSTQFTTGDVADLLTRYADALRGYNRPAFLALLDQSNTKLVAAQRRLFNNLRQVDLQTFQYVPVDTSLPQLDPLHPGSYTEGWSQAWRLIQIRGIDPRPGGQYFQVRLKASQGRLLISDITPSLGPGANRQPMPWDVSTLRVIRGQNVVVAGTADVAAQLGDVMRDAEAAIADAGPCWPPDWQRTFTIFATGDRATFDAWFRSRFTSTEFIGFEVGLPVVGTDGQVVSGAEDDIPQVVVDVPGARRAPLGFRALLEHELTHAASGAQRNPETETWAVEGYADFVAFHNGTLRQANRGGMAYRTYHAPGGLTVRLPTNRDFYGKGAALNYDLAFYAVWYLRVRYGQAAVIAWFHDANSGGNAGGLLEERFHLTVQQFVRDWAKWTFTQLK
ncbi:MAG TPA: hypothetical protein VLJ59_21335 [Mycobacteriales bacterium]|nr:hypothetical protein [Mycobacteriales bacterium]